MRQRDNKPCGSTAAHLSTAVLCLILLSSIPITGRAQTDIVPNETLVPSLFPIVRDGKWGYIDAKGRIAIEPQFEVATDFSEGLAAVILDKRLAYIDASGQRLLPPHFDPPSTGMGCHSDKYGPLERTGFLRQASFHDGLALVTDPVTNRQVFINKSGMPAFTHDCDLLSGFSEGLAIGIRDGKRGYINTKGSFVIHPQYPLALPFSEGLAVAADPEGPAEMGKSHFGFIDKSGRFAIAPLFSMALPFSDGLAAVQFRQSTGDVFRDLNAPWKFIDHAGTVVVHTDFWYVGSFSEGLAFAQTDVTSVNGYIDKSGKYVIAPSYKVSHKFSGGLAAVSADFDTLGYIDKTGRYVWRPQR